MNCVLPRLALYLGPVCAVFMLISGLAGCGSGSSGPDISSLPSAVQQAVRAATPVNASLVTANNTLGFQLFNAARSQNGSGNLFLSPTSLALALEIAYNGAAGNTQTQMQQALQLQGIGLSDLNAGNAALQASLVSPDPKVTLTIANSLWTRAGVVKAGFVQANTTYYGSELGDVSGLPDNVNAWIAKKTNNLITTLLPPADYSNTIAVIANAIYFKGQWSTQFDPAETQNASFTLADGSKVTVPMMHQQGDYAYLQGDHYQMARLPYGNGRLSMIVVLPDEGTTLESVLSALNAATLTAQIGQMRPQHGFLAVPRFTASYGAEMKGFLSALGMADAFDPNRADFSGLADQAYLTFVYHKTFVKVNEEGTEAAAATGVGVGATSVPAGFQFALTRPFFYAIRDDKTGVLLFLGQMMNPAAAQ